MSGSDGYSVSDSLEELNRYNILDSESEEGFDRITQLVRRLFAVSMSTVTFIDGHRQWFKSRQGVTSSETPRDLAFCQVPLLENAPLVVADTFEDARFCENPLVRGAPNIRFYAGVPLKSPRGIAVGTLCAMDTAPRQFSSSDLSVLSDLARLAELQLELRLQATNDSLTGALSRRAFFLAGERAIALADRHRSDITCLIFDLDHFKTINDSFGHAAGDAVLRKTAQICQGRLRKSDIFGRLGGEEFGVILSYTEPADGLKIAEELRETIASHVFALPTGRQVTASFGAAVFDPTKPDIALLLEHADQAMYQAKRTGRNRSAMWQGTSGGGDADFTRRVLKAGKIVFNNGGSVVDCTVRRLSTMGARLEVVATDGLPRRFKLHIPTDKSSRLCTITETGQARIDVAFV